MDPGIYLYRGKLFQLEDTREGAHFKSSGGIIFLAELQYHIHFKEKSA